MYFISTVFSFLSMKTLILESYEVLYEKSNETQPVEFLVCVKQADLYPNKTEIDIKELRAPVQPPKEH